MYDTQCKPLIFPGNPPFPPPLKKTEQGEREMGVVKQIASTVYYYHPYFCPIHSKPDPSSFLKTPCHDLQMQKNEH